MGSLARDQCARPVGVAGQPALCRPREALVCRRLDSACIQRRGGAREYRVDAHARAGAATVAQALSRLRKNAASSRPLHIVCVGESPEEMAIVPTGLVMMTPPANANSIWN